MGEQVFHKRYSCEKRWGIAVGKLVCVDEITV